MTGQPQVILVGNFAPDGLQSMLRFGALMDRSLRAAGVQVVSIAPEAWLSRLGGTYRYGGWKKWLGYVDKFILFPRRLNRTLREAGRHVVHVVDHGNAMYVPSRRCAPWLVTCHDLLAVRASLGEQTFISPTRMGRLLQGAVMRGLRDADHVACVSGYTRNDWIRLSGTAGAAGKSTVIPNALNHEYRRIDASTARERLEALGLGRLVGSRFVLHVGSNERRKNRPGVLRAAARFRETVPCLVVLAGAPLGQDLRDTAAELRIDADLIEVSRPSTDVLEALYSLAYALVFPSYFEGFGWPIIEAQACGAPVICSDSSSMPEVAGPGAMIHGPDDVNGIAGSLRQLLDAGIRDATVARGFANARNHSVPEMSRRYLGLYEAMLSQRHAALAENSP